MTYISIICFLFYFITCNLHRTTGQMALHRGGKWCLSHLPGNDCFISHYCSHKSSKQILIKSFKVNGHPFKDDSKQRYEWDFVERFLWNNCLIFASHFLWLIRNSETFLSVTRNLLTRHYFLFVYLHYVTRYGFDRISRNESHPFGFKVDILRWDRHLCLWPSMVSQM